MNTNKNTAGSDKAWIDTNGKGNFVSTRVCIFDQSAGAIGVKVHFCLLLIFVLN